MKKLFSSIWRLFISRRFAIGLLIIISILLLLGILFPTLSYHTPEEMDVFQKEHPILYLLGSVFDPPNLVTSRAFIILTTLLFASTIICSIERIRNRNFRDPYAGTPEKFRSRKSAHAVELPEIVMEQAVSLLRADRWRQIETENEPSKVAVLGKKGSFGFWGSLVFHLGFLIILLGVIVSSNTRMNASLLIAEGQSIEIDESAFTTVTRRPKVLVLPKFSIQMSRVETVWKKGIFPVDYSALLKIIDDEGRVKKVRAKVNKAVRYENMVFIMENFGYAPGFRALANDGEHVFEGYINLRGRQPGSRDSFEIPERNLTVETSFLPDKRDKQSLDPKNPVYYLKVKEGDQTQFEGAIEPGQTVSFKDLTLEFTELRKWVYFRVVRDFGVDILFWGFVVSFLGLVVRFFLHERTIKITIVPDGHGSKIMVSGKSQYFPAIFKEKVQQLAEQLTDERERL